MNTEQPFRNEPKEPASARQRFISEPTIAVQRLTAAQKNINRTRLFVFTVMGALAVTAGAVVYFGPSKEDKHNSTHSKIDPSSEPVIAPTAVIATAAQTVINSAQVVPSAQADLHEPAAEPAPQPSVSDLPEPLPPEVPKPLPSSKTRPKKSVIMHEVPF